MNPLSDPFLREHRFRDRPLLPMVIMTELLAESASQAQSSRRPVVMRDLNIVTSIKFPTDATSDVRVVSQRIDRDHIQSELRAD
ncbi:hypothetical protein ABTH33_20105, partial [Acinetobacter baumannii]